MIEDEIEDLYELTGEDFYEHVEREYGRNVVKILKYHDIDSYLILNGANEHEIVDVFEKPNDENCSAELIALKKDICNFIHDKVSLKIGTKGKMIFLLNSAHDVVKKKRGKLLSGKRSNGNNNSNSSSSSTSSLTTTGISLKEYHVTIERSIMALIRSAKYTIHGVTVANLSSNNFKIDIQSADDDNKPTGFVECMCGDRIRLYYRNNAFQLSNLSKHLKSTYNKSTFIVNTTSQQNNNPELSNDMILSDENLEKEDQSSLFDNTHNEHMSTDNDSSINSSSTTNIETSHQQLTSRLESNNNDDGDSSAEETNNFHYEQQSSRVLSRTSGNDNSISFNNQSRSKKQSQVHDTPRTSSLPPNIRSIKRLNKQNGTRSISLTARNQKLTDNNKQVKTNSSSNKNSKASNNRRISDKTSEPDFLCALLETIDINSHRSPNNYKYPQCVFRFSTAISILAGRYVYEYLRLNLRYLLPTIQTIENNWSSTPYLEAMFRFDESKTRLNSIQCKYIFMSEDCSAIIPRIQYDSNLDVFNGFATPIVEGVPIENAFRCTSFEQLEDLFETISYSKLVNIHVVQPIVDSSVTISPSATVLSAYGTDNKLCAIDILKRWLMIFKKFYSSGIRVLGYSTDGDPKYLRAMRLAANFFVNNQTLNIYNDTLIFTVNIPSAWLFWYFLSANQLFVLIQDGVHICTKMRNRLLSKSADLLMGVYKVSMGHLHELIKLTNKIDHNLSKSDLNVKDKQNFASCQKISDEKVLDLLLLNDKHKATYNYLLILNLLIVAYTERSVSLIDRIYYAWIVLFYIRLWRIWLHVTKPSRKLKISPKQKNRNRKRNQPTNFITSNAMMCIELNAHYLIFLYLLIEQKILPQSVAENVHLLSSQPCENVFRNARALSGVYSTRINFTITQFLARINKLNVLTELKEFEMTNKEHKIVFPVHHKIKRLVSSKEQEPSSEKIMFNTKSLEEIILQAYQVAQQMAVFVGMSSQLIGNNLFQIEQSSNLAKQLLQLNGLTESETLDVGVLIDDEESSDEDESNVDDDEELIDIIYDDNLSNEDLNPTSSFQNLQTKIYSGLRLTKSVAASNVHKYFAVDLHGEKWFLHKQTATWFLQEKQQRLSCDRLQRVQMKKVS